MKTTILVIAAVLTARVSPAQEILPTPFMTNNAPVPAGFTVDLAAATPVHGNMNVPVYAWAGLSLGGVLQVGYSNEGSIGNVVGHIRACPGWEARIQIARQREELPSVALWVRGTIGWQQEELGADDLRGKVPTDWFFDTRWTHYEFTSTAAGITLEPGLGKYMTLDLSVGYRECASRDLWIVSYDYPGEVVISQSTSSDRASLIEGSANLMIRTLPRLALILQAATLPYFKLNPPAFQLELGRGYLGVAGVRYALPIPVCVDAYVRWHSPYAGETDTQVRLGLSSELKLNEQ